MNVINPLELGQQLKKPSGESGKIIGENMNISNCSMYSFAFSMIDFNDNDRILEIGFGNGEFFSNYFNINPNIKVFGIDHSDVMFSEAILRNERYIDKKLFLKCENSIYTSFEDNYFDTIITINTIYFWEPFNKQVEEINRILKRGGKLVLGFGPKSIMEKLPFTKEVFKLFESSEVINILQKHNLKIIDEKMQNVTKKSVVGEVINSINICIVAENCKY
jgi:ubiquinone/menaquinone biosynthesis C-methylase UbiE